MTSSERVVCGQINSSSIFTIKRQHMGVVRHKVKKNPLANINPSSRGLLTEPARDEQGKGEAYPSSDG